VRGAWCGVRGAGCGVRSLLEGGKGERGDGWMDGYGYLEWCESERNLHGEVVVLGLLDCLLYFDEPKVAEPAVSIRSSVQRAESRE
jgi:hypothetical protein